MSKPTGKLLQAYKTITIMAAKIKKLEQVIKNIPCAGKNCTSVAGSVHSADCIADHGSTVNAQE